MKHRQEPPNLKNYTYGTPDYQSALLQLRTRMLADRDRDFVTEKRMNRVWRAWQSVLLFFIGYFAAEANTLPNMAWFMVLLGFAEWQRSKSRTAMCRRMREYDRMERDWTNILAQHSKWLGPWN